MPDVKKNAYQKLLEVRFKFWNLSVQQTGKNRDLAYKYFELEDIINNAMPLFNEVGLLPAISIDETNAMITLTNVEDPADCVIFSLPTRMWNPMEQGNKRVNIVQATGATVTYYRRYLYFLALDVCVPDELDDKQSIQNGQKEEEKAAPATGKIPIKPATPEERSEVKKELAATDAPAEELQVKGLKAVLKKLKDTKPESEEWINKIVVATEKFTKMTKKQCEDIIAKANGMMEAK